MRDWINQATEKDLEDLETLVAAERDLPFAGDAGAAQVGTVTDAGNHRFLVRTLGAVAAFLGLQLQTVKEWRTGPNPMPGEEGRWPLGDIVRWRIAKLQYTAREPQAKGALENESLEIGNARGRLKLRTEAAELVSRAAAKAAVAEMFNRLRNQLEPLPDHLANSVPVAFRNDFLMDCRHRVKLFLTQIANWRLETEEPGTTGTISSLRSDCSQTEISDQ